MTPVSVVVLLVIAFLIQVAGIRYDHAKFLSDSLYVVGLAALLWVAQKWFGARPGIIANARTARKQGLNSEWIRVPEQKPTAAPTVVAEPADSVMDDIRIIGKRGTQVPQPARTQQVREPKVTAKPHVEVKEIPRAPEKRQLSSAELVAIAAAERSAALPQVSDDIFPIDDYDNLSASQIVKKLGELDYIQLQHVEAYEVKHENRQSVLNRIEQLYTKYEIHGDG